MSEPLVFHKYINTSIIELLRKYITFRNLLKLPHPVVLLIDANVFAKFMNIVLLFNILKFISSKSRNGLTAGELRQADWPGLIQKLDS